MLYQLISKSLELEEERKWGSLIDNPRYNTYKHIFGASQPKKIILVFLKESSIPPECMILGNLPENPLRYLPNLKIIFYAVWNTSQREKSLTVCKSSAGDSGKKARRLIAEAPEMPFHTALISRSKGVMYSFSRKSWKKVKGCEFFRLYSKEYLTLIFSRTKSLSI